MSEETRRRRSEQGVAHAERSVAGRAEQGELAVDDDLEQCGGRITDRVTARGEQQAAST